MPGRIVLYILDSCVRLSLHTTNHRTAYRRQPLSSAATLNTRFKCYIYLYNKKYPVTSEARAVHSPQLDTILMVESFIREHSGEYKKRALWENLPRKMMYQTFSTVISYLQDSGKIATDADKKICWIYNPELIHRYLRNNNLKIR